MFLMNFIDPIVEATYMVSFSLRMRKVYTSNIHVESSRRSRYWLFYIYDNIVKSYAQVLVHSMFNIPCLYCVYNDFRLYGTKDCISEQSRITLKCMLS